jgi:hypothetical protein
MPIQENVYLFLTAIFGLLFVKMAISWSKRPKYLPGPPRLPLIGNLLQMPESEAWVTYKKWGETYGALVGILTSPRMSTHTMVLVGRRRHVPRNLRQPHRYS